MKKLDATNAAKPVKVAKPKAPKKVKVVPLTPEQAAIRGKMPPKTLRTTSKHKVEVLKLARTAKFMELDLETTGLSPFDEQIITLAISFNYGKQKFWWDVREGVPTFLQAIVEDAGIQKVIHKALFDGTFMLWHWKWIVRNIFDTCEIEDTLLGIGEPPIYVNQRSPEYIRDYSSKLAQTLARYDLGDMDKAQQTSFVGMKITDKLMPEQVDYLLGDVDKLARLRDKQIEKATRLGMLETVWLENNTTEALIQMRNRGIGFDKAIWDALAEANEARLSQEMAKLYKMTKVPDTFNWNSHPQIKSYFAGRGIVIASLSDLTLKDGSTAPQFKGIDKHLDQFISTRYHAKYVSTYGKSWYYNKWGTLASAPIYPSLGPDGRVHADIRQTVATGRMSASKPNLTQLPNNVEGDPLHDQRKAFVPTKGHVFISQDFSGQEPGIMAAMSQEPAWLAILQKGADIHGSSTQILWPQRWAEAAAPGCTFPKKCQCPGHKKLREDVKEANLGIPYGMSETGLALKMGTSKLRAGAILSAHAKAFPVLHAWLKTQGEQGIRHFETRTMPRFNRRRSLELVVDAWARRNQGKNSPIQGTGADMLKLTIVRLHKLCESTYPWLRILLSVHDEIIAECPRGKATLAVKIMKETAEAAAAEILGYTGLVKSSPEVMEFWYPKSFNPNTLKTAI